MRCQIGGVVPAKAGTHTAESIDYEWSLYRTSSLRQTTPWGNGSRPSPGRRLRVERYRKFTLRSDPRRKLAPRLQRPMPGRRAGRRGEHEYFRQAFVARLPPQLNSARRPAVKQARRLLARERNRPRPILFDLGPEAGHVDRCGRDLVIH